MLNNIPHLPVPMFFDQEKMIQEVSKIPYEFPDYVSGLSNGIDMQLYKDNWKSLALYSIDGSVNSDPREPWTGEFKKTQLDCPYIYSVLDTIGCSLLARIEIIMPNKSVGWHSHVMEGKQPEWISILQFPLVMPEDSKFSVVSYMDYRGSDYKKKFKVYEERYKPGQVYVINSYHYHNAFNYSEKPMVMLRVYVDNRELTIKYLLEKSMEYYSGEYIQTYEDYINSIGLT